MCFCQYYIYIGKMQWICGICKGMWSACQPGYLIYSVYMLFTVLKSLIIIIFEIAYKQNKDFF